MADLQIPSITDARIKELLGHIRPCVRDARGDLCFILPVDARRCSFVWSPKLDEAAKGLSVLAKIHTLHIFSYPAFFKPSIAEVLAQIPLWLVDKVGAFETCGPETMHEMYEEHEMLNAGYHVAETTLYGLIEAQPEIKPSADTSWWNRLDGIESDESL